MSRVENQYAEAQQYLAGGVSSSTRVNQAIGRPLFFDRAAGCRVWDLDGREYIDLCCSHGATLIGHGDERVRAAVEEALERGAACSYENELHTNLARLLCETVPCLELVRFTGSGTEATLHCIRLARASTGRRKLLKFEGNFHGYHDQVMYSSLDEEGASLPAGEFRQLSAGMPPGLDDHLIEVPYNDVAALEQVFAERGHEIAAAICEAVYYNAGCVQPRQEWITALRQLTAQHGAILIFDEVLSAFRMAPGGAQQHLGVTPDLCTIGKAVGGGYPLSVFGGRREIMERLMPQGDSQHSGTYNGHPSAVAAATAAISIYRETDFYAHVNQVGKRLFDGLNQQFQRHGVDAHVQGLGARFGVYFGIGEEVRDYRTALRHDREKMLRFIASSISEGVYFHDYGGVACHHGFCRATEIADVDEALERLDRAIGKM